MNVCILPYVCLLELYASEGRRNKPRNSVLVGWLSVYDDSRIKILRIDLSKKDSIVSPVFDHSSKHRESLPLSPLFFSLQQIP